MQQRGLQGRQKFGSQQAQSAGLSGEGGPGLPNVWLHHLNILICC